MNRRHEPDLTGDEEEPVPARAPKEIPNGVTYEYRGVNKPTVAAGAIVEAMNDYGEIGFRVVECWQYGARTQILMERAVEA